MWAHASAQITVPLQVWAPGLVNDNAPDDAPDTGEMPTYTLGTDC